VLWHPTPSRPDALESLLAGCRDDRLSYDAVGCSLDTDTPPGLTRRAWSRPLAGPESFRRVAAALGAWEVHRRAGLRIATDGAVAVGTNIAFDAPLPLGFVTGICRVVEVVDEENRFGFAYGTLGHHPERGEESFLVRRTSEGGSTFEVVALSAHAHPVARLVPPLGNRLQEAATGRYLRAASESADRP
jgi:uncharacterized protein (UPF0548 family)